MHQEINSKQLLPILRSLLNGYDLWPSAYQMDIQSKANIPFLALNANDLPLRYMVSDSMNNICEILKRRTIKFFIDNSLYFN